MTTIAIVIAIAITIYNEQCRKESKTLFQNGSNGDCYCNIKKNIFQKVFLSFVAPIIFIPFIPFLAFL